MSSNRALRLPWGAVCLLLLASCDESGTSAAPADAASESHADAPGDAIPQAVADAAPIDAVAAPATPWDGGPMACAAKGAVVDCKSADPNAPADVSIPISGSGEITMSVETAEPKTGFVGLCLAQQPSVDDAAVLPQVCYAFAVGASDGGVEQASWATFTVPATVATTYPYYEMCGLDTTCVAVSRSCCDPPIPFLVGASSATGQVNGILQSDSD